MRPLNEAILSMVLPPKYRQKLSVFIISLRNIKFYTLFLNLVNSKNYLFIHFLLIFGLSELIFERKWLTNCSTD